MAAWSHMVDMARSRADKEEIVGVNDNSPMPDPVDFVSDYPAGLTLCFDEETLEKLDLDDDVAVGDMIDIRAFAKVTSVSMNASLAGGRSCRIELQITNMSVENEATEEEDEDE